MRDIYRHTKIIFTLGPATADEDVLVRLLDRGVDICRLNMAHASHEWTRSSIRAVRKACKRAGREIAIMMDVKGPEIRTGALEEPFQLKREDSFSLFLDPKHPTQYGEDPGVAVNYAGLAKNLKVDDTVLVDSGLIRFRVTEINEDRIRCSVRIGGELGSRRHINLPGIKVNLPSLTEKDRADIAVGIEEGVDFFALSFVREPEDLDILRRYISSHGSKANIVAKIEDQSAISNLDDIIQASDGLMVARGDLGIEIPYDTLPLVQRRAVKACQAMGKPVIVATHMLESMIENAMPSRAEITDIANAVFEQADCVMLSGETTVGKFPVKCVEVLNRVIRTIENNSERHYNNDIRLTSPKALMLRSAAIFSDEMNDAAILVFTRSGFLARTLSAIRPRRSPIFAFTDAQRIFQNLLIYWGVEPFLMDFDDDPEITIMKAFDRLKANDWIQPGKKMVVISTMLAGEKMVDNIQFRVVE